MEVCDLKEIILIESHFRNHDEGLYILCFKTYTEETWSICMRLDSAATCNENTTIFDSYLNGVSNGFYVLWADDVRMSDCCGMHILWGSCACILEIFTLKHRHGSRGAPGAYDPLPYLFGLCASPCTHIHPFIIELHYIAKTQLLTQGHL